MLATGGTPRRLGGEDDDVIYFRTLDDYRRVARVERRGRALRSSSAAASSAPRSPPRSASQGRDVTMVFPEPGIGWRNFPPELARFVAEYYRRAWCGRSGAGSATVRTSSAPEGVPADAVVAGLGIVPNIELAESAGLPGRRRHRRRRVRARRGPEDVFADRRRRALPDRRRSARASASSTRTTPTRTGGSSARTRPARTSATTTCRSSTPTCSTSATRRSARLDSRQDAVEPWREPIQKGVVAFVDVTRTPRGFCSGASSGRSTRRAT